MLRPERDNQAAHVPGSARDDDANELSVSVESGRSRVAGFHRGTGLRLPIADGLDGTLNAACDVSRVLVDMNNLDGISRRQWLLAYVNAASKAAAVDGEDSNVIIFVTKPDRCVVPLAFLEERDV